MEINVFVLDFFASFSIDFVHFLDPEIFLP